ncbi:hypothetical protein G9A89_013312 [Geosiphon pyriformis]|nr:hypothetical protein G9A89_013312 [Geosiphon pyriformis]
MLLIKVVTCFSKYQTNPFNGGLSLPRWMAYNSVAIKKWKEPLKNGKHTLSNRKKFQQIRPAETTLLEIEKLGLARKRFVPGGYGKKIVFLTKKKWDERIERNKKMEEVVVEGLELPRFSFFAGAETPSSIPSEDLPEIAFVGRSNVGKSSLINALGDTITARTSDKPGMTRQLNFYAAGRLFNLVDMPGYGFAHAKEENRDEWRKLIETYITTRKTLKRIFLLVDARHGVKFADVRFIRMLEENKIQYQFVLTKCDLVNSSNLARQHILITKELANYRFGFESPLMISAKTKAGIDKMRREMLFLVGGLEKAREYLKWKKANEEENDRMTFSGLKEKSRTINDRLNDTGSREPSNRLENRRPQSFSKKPMASQKTMTISRTETRTGKYPSTSRNLLYMDRFKKAIPRKSNSAPKTNLGPATNLTHSKSKDSNQFDESENWLNKRTPKRLPTIKERLRTLIPNLKEEKGRRKVSSWQKEEYQFLNKNN